MVLRFRLKFSHEGKFYEYDIRISHFEISRTVWFGKWCQNRCQKDPAPPPPSPLRRRQSLAFVSHKEIAKWAPSSEFVSSSIPSWQILTAHAWPFRGAIDLAFCLEVPLDSLLVWASSRGSGETARMRRLAWTFAARIGDKTQIRLTRPK